jgi:hypothetical protein
VFTAAPITSAKTQRNRWQSIQSSASAVSTLRSFLSESGTALLAKNLALCVRLMPQSCKSSFCALLHGSFWQGSTFLGIRQHCPGMPCRPCSPAIEHRFGHSKYNVPVQQSRHKDLNEYISNAVLDVRDWISRGAARSQGARALPPTHGSALHRAKATPPRRVSCTANPQRA